MGEEATRGTIFWLAVALAASHLACSSDDEQEAPRDERFETLVAYMEEQHAANGVPGGAVAVVIDGKLAHAAGVGVTSLGGSTPVTPDTRFRVASVTKPHVALAALSLVEEGKLALDVPVTDYVPELTLKAGFDPTKITLHHLLAHTSGLPDRNPITVPDGWLSCPLGESVLSEYFATEKETPLWTEPGEIYNYCNLGFSLAGLMVEKAAGKPVADVLTERVFERGGLDAHTLDIGVAMAGDHALGHRLENGKTGAPFEPDKYQCDVDTPAAGLMTTVRGLAKFGELMLREGQGVITPESYAKMSAAQTETRERANSSYGYGWQVEQYKGVSVWGHGGDYYGYRTEIAIVPEKNFAVAVMENRSPSSAFQIALKALDTFLDLSDIPLTPETKDAAALAPYVGKYFEPYTFGTAEAKIVGNDLELSILNGAIVLPTQYVGGDSFSFIFQGTPGSATFWPGPSGQFDVLATRAGVGRRTTP